MQCAGSIVQVWWCSEEQCDELKAKIFKLRSTQKVLDKENKVMQIVRNDRYNLAHVNWIETNSTSTRSH